MNSGITSGDERQRPIVFRAFLGVNLDPQFTQAKAAELGMSHTAGARVTGITPGTPAEAANLRIGDVIVKFNGIQIEDDGHLINVVALWTPIGKEVEIEVLREGRTVTVRAQVTVRPKSSRERR